jgi:carboxymethylenebutenolidase
MASMNPITLPYFLATPQAAPPWPGLVVIHEGNGISPQLLRFCQRMAANGYAAIAPDLYFRAGGTEAADFATLMGGLDQDGAFADIESAAATLCAAGASNVGITGFCMGGSFSYRTARRSTTFACALGYYGFWDMAEMGPTKCPTKLIYGGSDEYIPMSVIDAFAARHPDTIVYPEAGHGFMRDGSDSYHEASADDASAKMMAFFAEHLR